MTGDNDWGACNPDTEVHGLLIDQIYDIISEEQPIKTPDIHDQVLKTLKGSDPYNIVEKRDGNIWKKKYLRYRLIPDTLEFMEKGREEIKKELRAEGGNETHYWSIK